MTKRMRSRRVGLVLGILLSCWISVCAEVAPFIEQPVRQYGADTIHTYCHKTSGLTVTWIENTSPNKSFILGVKTPTVDNTGVNHIIEHTVFTGSENYPSSTLFFDASSQYPSLFMNAMTTSDLTLYPFATLHEESYMKLLGIYLDSVFKPKMLSQPWSFYEESFYYDPIREQTGGVVYNEMKGANNNPDRQLFRCMRQGLYEGTHYANDSGGEVDAIPTLSYNQFKETYKAYYYPGNMMIVLYGDIPLEETLSCIDDYVADYPLTDKQIKLNVTTPPLAAEQTLAYPGVKGNTYFVKAFRFKEQPTPEEEAACDLWLQTYLVGEETAFGKVLKTHGVGQVQFVKDDDLEKPTYAFVVPNPKLSQEALGEVFDEALEGIRDSARDGAHEQDVLLREQSRQAMTADDVLQGLVIGQSYIDCWSHEKVLDSYYRQEAYLEALETVPDCSELFFNDLETTTLWVMPNGLEETTTPTLTTCLETSAWEAVVTEMTKWQEATKHCPLEALELKDLTIQPYDTPEVKSLNGVKYMLTADDTLSRPSYRLYLPTGTVAQADLPYLFLWSHLTNEMAQTCKPYKGDIETTVFATTTGETYTPYVRIAIHPVAGEDPRVMWDEVQEALRLQDTAWYESAIKKWTIQFYQQIQTDLLGTLRMLSLKSQSGAKRYLYETQYPLYTFCRALKQADLETTKLKIAKAGDACFFTDKAGIGIYAPSDTLTTEVAAWEDYVVKHKLEQVAYNNYSFPKHAKTTVYYKESPVDYVVCHYDKQQDTVVGADYVMGSYLTHYYLQPKLRVEKGAYGAGMYALYPNSMLTYTYRDPDFKSSVAFMETMVATAKEALDSAQIDAVKGDALGQMQKQFKLLSTPQEQVEVLEKLILQETPLRTLKTLQKQIIKTDEKVLGQQLEAISDVIDKKCMSICTKR